MDREKAPGNETSSVGALSDIRVLDLTRVLAGPWCTQILADLGAKVVKIERPRTGDDTRHWGPPWLKDPSGQDAADSCYYAAANRNKHSVCLDISKPEGQEIVRDLARQSDVLVENFKVGDLVRRGLGYEHLREVNPGLIYCSISGYGQTGPDSSRPGYDVVAQGEGGLMSITGVPEGQPGGGPQKAGPPVSDLMAGMYAAVSILAAVNARRLTGRGQHIDCALLDGTVAMNATLMAGFFVTGKPPTAYGNTHPNIVPYQTFRTEDGTILVAVGNEVQWRRFCNVLERPRLADDMRFRLNADRVRNREALCALLQETLRTRKSRYWLDRLRAADVPSGSINNYRQVFEDPQVQLRQLRLDLEREDGTTVTTVASPIRLSDTPVTYWRAPPLLGQDTADVLRNVLDFDQARIDELAAAGVI